jgi:hypothetical protein
MASDKRERQRANRAVKTAAHTKVVRKQKSINLVKRAAIWAVVGVVLILLANFVWG